MQGYRKQIVGGLYGASLEICWFYFSLRVRWSPGHDNPSKNFLQLPGTDVVDKLARLVGAGSEKSEWWTRPFTLNSWGETAFIAKLQGWSSAVQLSVFAYHQLQLAATSKSKRQHQMKHYSDAVREHLSFLPFTPHAGFHRSGQY